MQVVPELAVQHLLRMDCVVEELPVLGLGPLGCYPIHQKDQCWPLQGQVHFFSLQQLAVGLFVPPRQVGHYWSLDYTMPFPHTSSESIPVKVADPGYPVVH
jgi:hypothetical protein